MCSSVSDVNISELWIECQENYVPMHRFYDFIESKLEMIYENSKNQKPNVIAYWDSNNATQSFQQRKERRIKGNNNNNNNNNINNNDNSNYNRNHEQTKK